MKQRYINFVSLFTMALLTAVLFNAVQHDRTLTEKPLFSAEQDVNNSDAILAGAFSNRQSDIQVSGRGTVELLLPDDNRGNRHQRFVIRLSSGQTLLISHNIDIAPRVHSLRTGEVIRFYGEYEWNEKGSIIHWTHRDPDGSHIDGRIVHQGRKYQ